MSCNKCTSMPSILFPPLFFFSHPLPSLPLLPPSFFLLPLPFFLLSLTVWKQMLPLYDLEVA